MLYGMFYIISCSCDYLICFAIIYILFSGLLPTVFLPFAAPSAVLLIPGAGVSLPRTDELALRPSETLAFTGERTMAFQTCSLLCLCVSKVEPA